jgi:hypothetical protein
LANLTAGTAGLDEEIPEHCEQTLKFMTTCLIVNEPPQFVHSLGMIFDLMNRFVRASKQGENCNSPLCCPEGIGELKS